jgi:hypothetical protein
VLEFKSIQTGLSDGIFTEVTSGDLSVKSQLIVGLKAKGSDSQQSKGLIQGPKKTPNIR